MKISVLLLEHWHTNWFVAGDDPWVSSRCHQKLFSFDIVTKDTSHFRDTNLGIYHSYVI